MKRDMDIVRDLLLKLESSGEPGLADLLPEGATETDEAGITEHVRMMVDEAGLVTAIEGHTLDGEEWAELKLTWQGHDFLDSVRYPKVWAKTKKGAMAAGGFTVDLLKDLAKGLIRKQIEERTGVKL